MAPILGYQLAQASVATNQAFDAAVRADALALRQVEFTILALVDANPELLASALARALAVTPPNITMWLDRLETRGLIERQRSVTDRRAQHLRTTAAGAAAVTGLARGIVREEQAALALLSPGERVLLVELLRKLARSRTKVLRRAARTAAAG